MPNMKNAKKAVITTAKRKESNNNFKASMKTAIKNVERAVLSKDKEKAKKYEKLAIKCKSAFESKFYNKKRPTTHNLN